MSRFELITGVALLLLAASLFILVCASVAAWSGALS